MEERRKNLLAFVDHLLSVHDDWIQSKFDPLPQTFEEAADSLLDIFAEGAMPGDCRVLAQRVQEFGQQWEKWKAGGALAGEQYPESNGFWASLEAVRDAKALAAPEYAPPPLEAITELDRQKVGDAQICAIYGFGTLARPDMRKLAEERAQPGRHTGKDFIAPALREWADRQDRIAEHAAKIQEMREEKLTPPPVPEGIPELVQQGVSGAQIAAMHGKSLDEIYAECDRLKIPRPEENYADPHTVRGPHEPGIPDEVERAMPSPAPVKPAPPENVVMSEWDTEAPQAVQESPLTLDQEIAQLHQQGKDSAEIAELLSTPEVVVTPRKVAGAIRRFKSQPEAFSSPGG